jgi:hypothetical protein
MDIPQLRRSARTLHELPAESLAQGSRSCKSAEEDASRSQAQRGKPHACGRRGPGIRGVAARAFESGDNIEDLFALGSGNEVNNNFDPGRGIGKQSANAIKVIFGHSDVHFHNHFWETGG